MCAIQYVSDDKTINERQEDIIRAFEQLGDDWMQKYEYLIELGRKLPGMDPQYKVDENLIKGCQSQIWLHAFTEDEKVYFEVECEASIVKGIAALLIQILSGNTPGEIKEADLYCIDKIGLRKHLSPMRSNGLFALVRQMKDSGHAGITTEEKPLS